MPTYVRPATRHRLRHSFRTWCGRDLPVLATHPPTSNVLAVCPRTASLRWDEHITTPIAGLHTTPRASHRCRAAHRLKSSKSRGRLSRAQVGGGLRLDRVQHLAYLQRQ